MNRAIVVEESILPGIQPRIDLLVEHWERDGADEVHVLTHPRGVHLNAGTLRDLLRSIVDLEGALLLGELPVARVEDPSFSPAIHLSDQFFMELNGNWEIRDGNIVVDKDHLPPQVFIGRVFVDSETGWQEEATTGQKPSEIEFYNNYLEKLLRFRTWSRYIAIPRDFIGAEMVFPPWHRFNFRAVIINCLDDPAVRRAWLEHLYPPEKIDSHEEVTDNEFRQILAANSHDFVWILAHSSPGGHRLAGDTRWNACDYYSTNAIVNFVQIEGCSVASYVWEDYGDPENPGILKLISDSVIANILFTRSAGVLVIASSLSHVFPDVTVFFDKLREGVTFGRAFLHWSIIQAENGWPHGGDNVLLFGDPFARFGAEYYYCLIQTALEGTPMESKLSILRLWRDQVLLSTGFGRMITKLYYRSGPRFAALAGRSKRCRAIIRWSVALVLRILEASRSLPPRINLRD